MGALPPLWKICILVYYNSIVKIFWEAVNPEPLLDRNQTWIDSALPQGKIFPLLRNAKKCDAFHDVTRILFSPGKSQKSKLCPTLWAINWTGIKTKLGMEMPAMCGHVTEGFN